MRDLISFRVHLIFSTFIDTHSNFELKSTCFLPTNELFWTFSSSNLIFFSLFLSNQNFFSSLHVIIVIEYSYFMIVLIICHTFTPFFHEEFIQSSLLMINHNQSQSYHDVQLIESISFSHEHILRFTWNINSRLKRKKLSTKFWWMNCS